MSDTGIKLNRAGALSLAERFMVRLGEACARIEIAGSLRRQEETVGDIEIVCIAKPTPFSLGDPERTLIDDVIDDLGVRRVKNGQKYKQLAVEFFIKPSSVGKTEWPPPKPTTVMIDLFITTEECWPVIFAIRTGPTEYSRRLVTPVSRGGRLRDCYHVKDGRLWNDEIVAHFADDAVWDSPAEVVELVDERQFLDVYCGGWMEPQDRPKAG